MDTLRSLLNGPPIYAPLCLDALSARIARQAGFSAGYVSGGGLGYAHAVSEALLSVDELADVTRHVTARSELAIIVDGGVGFGDAVHLTRAVQQLEAAGAAAVEIEDQVAPKRVSHHRGMEHLIPQADMVDKIRYALDARRRDETLIIARTGAVKNESFARACERANAYHEAGAELILIMPTTEEDWQRLHSSCDAPLVCFGALGSVDDEIWRERGVNLVIDPFTPQVLAVRALRQAYSGFFSSGDIGTPSGEIFETYNELDTLAGFDSLYAIEDATTEKSDGG